MTRPSLAGSLAVAVLLGLALLCPPARGDSLQATFERGNRAFAAGDYGRAIAEYEALLELGVDDPDVTFNLASAYGQLGRYGQAIRYFERTLLLAPSDAGARQGLKQARTTLGERQAKLRGEAIVAERPALSTALFAGVHSDALAWLLLIASWLGAGAGMVLLWSRREAVRLGFGIALTVAVLTAAVAGFGLAAKAEFGAEGRRAVVIAEDAPLRNAPDEAAQLLGELPEGTYVRRLSGSAAYGFVRVRLGQGQEGFVRSDHVGEI